VSAIRVLRICHNAVVDEYRERDRLLRSRHGYDVHLIVPPRWHEGGSLVAVTPDPDVPVHVVGVHGRRHPNLFWYAPRALRRVLRELRPQLVDLHEEPYSLAAAAALRAIDAEVPGAPVCVYTAQNLRRRYPPPFPALDRRTLRRAAAMYPCSTEAGELLRARGFRGAVHVLGLGVAPRSPFPKDDRGDGGALRVGFLGRLETCKGGELAIRAFAAAADGLDASMEVVGAGSEREALELCAAKLGVAGRVHFTGAVSQDEALARIRGYDVVLVPSLTTRAWKEQFGRIPAQAMEAGTPVIASDSGALREVLGGCGELVREGDVADLTAALSRLLRDPDRRADLAARGRARAVGALSYETLSDGIDRMYREALATGCS
jgi:glycosyltransferase involved in cell wall biosynthesis